MYKLGLVSVSFRAHTPEEIFEAVKNAGLSAIEWGSDVHAPCTDIENIKKIAALGEKYSIDCSSYGTYFRAGENRPDEIIPYITAAKLLGTNILRIWCGTKNSEDLTDEESDALIADCREIAKIAEAEDVKICLECHNKTYTNRLSGALKIMEAVNSPNFKMYWQPNQYRTLEENLEYAEKIAKYTEIIHVFNWEGKEKYPLAEAADIWRKYLEFFDGNMTLLLEFMPDNDINSLKTESDSLFEIVK